MNISFIHLHNVTTKDLKWERFNKNTQRDVANAVRLYQTHLNLPNFNDIIYKDGENCVYEYKTEIDVGKIKPKGLCTPHKTEWEYWYTENAM